MTMGAGLLFLRSSITIDWNYISTIFDTITWFPFWITILFQSFRWWCYLLTLMCSRSCYLYWLSSSLCSVWRVTNLGQGVARPLPEESFTPKWLDEFRNTGFIITGECQMGRFILTITETSSSHVVLQARMALHWQHRAFKGLVTENSVPCLLRSEFPFLYWGTIPNCSGPILSFFIHWFRVGGSIFTHQLCYTWWEDVNESIEPNVHQ